MAEIADGSVCDTCRGKSFAFGSALSIALTKYHFYRHWAVAKRPTASSLLLRRRKTVRILWNFCRHEDDWKHFQGNAAVWMLFECDCYHVTHVGGCLFWSSRRRLVRIVICWLASGSVVVCACSIRCSARCDLTWRTNPCGRVPSLPMALWMWTNAPSSIACGPPCNLLSACQHRRTT